jgi:hypothetical protein
LSGNFCNISGNFFAPDNRYQGRFLLLAEAAHPLDGAVAAMLGFDVGHFNSNLVRLKGSGARHGPAFPGPFQFQPGSIKSGREKSEERGGLRFQFQPGSIKSDIVQKFVAEIALEY